MPAEPRPTTILSLRLPQDLHERLKALAQADGRSMNGYLVRLIRLELERQRVTQGPWRGPASSA